MSAYSTTAVRKCRMRFLRSVVEHPKIGLTDSLTKQVYEPSVKLWGNLGLHTMPFMRPDYKKDKTPEQFLALETFYREQWYLIENWSVGHHLNFEWVHSEAAKELSFWPILRKRPFDWISRCEPPDFRWEPWVFEREEEIPYRKRMKAKFMEALAEYVAQVRQMRKIFLPDRGSRSAHYRWTAEHVCLGWTWGDIASANPVHVSWQAVCQAVEPILKRIGIPGSTTQKTKK